MLEASFERHSGMVVLCFVMSSFQRDIADHDALKTFAIFTEYQRFLAAPRLLVHQKLASGARKGQ
jgi:hypothetical protein